jgi:hypothetical protein
MRLHARSRFFFVALALGALALGAGPASALDIKENAQGMGLGYFGWTQGRIPAFDANADGVRDLLLNAHNEERWWLMLGRRDGTFVKSDAVPFKKYDLHGCVAADFASPAGGPDGKVDLFCTTGADGGQSSRLYNKQLFVQSQAGSFVDLAVQRGLGMPFDRGRDALAVNLNGDNALDLVTAALRSPTGKSFSRAFVNANGRFTELPKAKFPVDREPGSECMAVLPKVDRFDDVLYCIKSAARGNGVAHFRNVRGVLTEVTSAGYLKLAARKIAFADLNRDAMPDLVVLTSGELSVWFNNGANAFPIKNVAVPVAQGWAFAVCRIDADQDLDVFVAQGKDPHANVAQQQDVALLNTGAGTSFTRFVVPQRETEGNADWVTCLENWQGTGHAMVYVTNGRWLLSGHNRAYVFQP